MSLLRGWCDQLEFSASLPGRKLMLILALTNTNTLPVS
jgi:hypothetical protein